MFTAHIQSDTGREHSIADHSRDVARLCEDYGRRVGLASLCKLCALIHDMGKFTQEFQNYLYFCLHNPNDAWKLRGTVNHTGAGARYIMETYGVSKDRYRNICAQIVALVVTGHHGGLPDVLDSDGKSPFLRKMDSVEQEVYEEAKRNFFLECCTEQEIDDLFNKACDELRVINKLPKPENPSYNPLFFYIHLIVKFAYSCLIDADRYDTYRFMSGKDDLPAINTQALWAELCEKIEQKTESMPNRYAIDSLRKECSDACLSAAEGESGIYRLCLPTGLGKTLSSLRFALHHAKKTHKDRIFYIIPYKTIIDQTAKTFTEVFDHPGIMLEHHSDIIPEDAVRELLHDKGVSEDNLTALQEELQRWELTTERYDSPIILTTLVQFFNSFYGSSGSLRRLHRFANSVIVFDEVQTVPVKCIHLFNMAVNFLTSICGSTVVLCTATQPGLERAHYKLHIGDKADIVSNYEDIFRATKRVEILPRLRIGGYNSAELADFVLDKLDENRSLLAILNTKTDAASLFYELSRINEALPEDERFFLCYLSTSLCPAHRREIIKELSEALKDPSYPQKIICVSTQIIEAGIDVSFACVVRALAGLDCIAQAAGRCNRNGDAAVGHVYLVNIAKENLDKLPEIKIGAEKCRQILEESNMGRLPFEGDLLSPAAINHYFRLYYDDFDPKMDYPFYINDVSMNANIFDLLNQNYRFAQIVRDNFKYKLMLLHAYKTAARHFEVIDSNTIPVLVPYGEEGKRIIAALNGNCSLEIQKLELGKAQQYSVNLFRYQFDELVNHKGAIKPLLNGGVFALNESHYSNTLGVISESELMPFLNQ